MYATITAHRSRLGCIGTCHHGRRLGRQRCVSAGVYAFESLDAEHCVTIGGRIMARCCLCRCPFQALSGHCLHNILSLKILPSIRIRCSPTRFIRDRRPGKCPPPPLSLSLLFISAPGTACCSRSKSGSSSSCRRRQPQLPPAMTQRATRSASAHCFLVLNPILNRSLLYHSLILTMPIRRRFDVGGLCAIVGQHVTWGVYSWKHW